MNNQQVAWMWSEDGCNLGVCLEQDKQVGKKEFQDYDIPLYTHPAKTLTDEEVDSIWEDTTKGYRNFARAILKKASEK